MSNKKQLNEIKWNIVNSLLAGALVFFGAFTTGHLSWESVVAALGAASIVCITKFKDYWTSEEKEYSSRKVFNFVNL